MLEIFQRGGFLMYPIFLCSIVGLAVIVERWMHLHKASRGMGLLAHRVRNSVSSGDMPGALATCRSERQPLSRVLLAGLSRAKWGEDAVRRALVESGGSESDRLERHMGILATVVGGAPLLGFLGTVLGMINAFQQIERLGGNVDASVLAGGIWQALLTTAAGLSVGVFAFFAYNFLHGKSRAIVTQMEDASERLVSALFYERPAPEERPRPTAGDPADTTRAREGAGA